MEHRPDILSSSLLSLERAAADAGELPFLRNSQVVLTYADVAETVRPAARALAHEAARHARPVVWLRLHPTIESVLAALTCIEAGVPFASAHPRWTEAEAAARIHALEGSDLLHLPTAGRSVTWSAPREIDEASALAVLFTSGTSGVSAPVVLSREAFIESAAASRSAIMLDETDRWLLSMPLAHVGGLSIVVRCLLARACVVIDAGSFDPRRWSTTLREHGITLASVVPTMLRRVVDAQIESPPSLRCLVVGGAACDEGLARDARNLEFPIRRSYGMTETCSMIACEAAPGQGGSGRNLLGVELKTVGGEICVRSGTLATGIFHKHGIVPLRLDEEGWFATGDLGRVDPTGIVHVEGRRSEVIITGGENVHPAEIESALLALHGVSQAVVFGVDDGQWGSRVAAAVVVDEPSITPHLIAEQLRMRLSGFKRPKAYAVLSELPMLASGKVDRRGTVVLATPRLIET